MKNVALLAVPFAAVLAIGCSDRPTEARAPAILRSTSKADTNSRANYVFADSVHVTLPGDTMPAWVLTGIRGDGRLKTGTAAAPGSSPSNEYQASYCGVAARFSSGDLDYTPGIGWTSSMQLSCGPARVYMFYLNGPGSTPSGWSAHSFARGLALLAPGQSVVQWEGFGSPVSSCAKLVFDDAYPPANSPRQTRLADVGTTSSGRVIRQWRIESQGSHRAMCMNYSHNGAPLPTGTTYFLPFAITLTEVPYPYPSYP